ncbi:hypothetical protein LBMAG53_21670 [Planctomycetota bacterium]|nr:hypothetical protein LBMAG53_21670 [Planctomycetota bacterium]
MTSLIIQEAIKAGVPLIELMCKIRKGISAELACEEINRYNDGVEAYAYGDDSFESRKSIVVQIHPKRAECFGVTVMRVPINENYPNAGMKWKLHSIDIFCERFRSVIEDAYLSQPGAHDDAQQWP